jgi:hypothetical protein
MFEHHRKSPWFAEKYDPTPDFANMRMRVRKIGWKGRMSAFLTDLEAGKFDPSFNEPEPEPVVSPVKETPAPVNVAETATNGNATKTEEETTGVEEGKNGPEDAQLEDGGGEDDPSKAEANGKGPVDKRNANRGEEVEAVTEGNQVMIRTIPPDIGRLKLEDVSFVR